MVRVVSFKSREKVLRLERDAWSIAKSMTKASNKQMTPPCKKIISFNSIDVFFCGGIPHVFVVEEEPAK